jgi:hypothetical protein
MVAAVGDIGSDLALVLFADKQIVVAINRMAKVVIRAFIVDNQGCIVFSTNLVKSM